MRDAEGQHHDNGCERDHKRQHGTDQDGGRGRALTLGRDLAEVRGLLDCRVDRVMSEAFVLPYVGALMLFHAATIAPRAARVCTASAKFNYPPAGIRGLPSARG